MRTATTYGGWVTHRPDATGVTRPLARWAQGLMPAAIATAMVLGTGGELSPEHLQHWVRQAQHPDPASALARVQQVRSPGEDLSRIREVLKPAVSDLATTFGVSRQSIYNWLNGEPVAQDNAAKLQDLARAADVLAHAGMVIDAALLKRKFANGRTLLQVAQAGQSARDAALMLVRIHQRESIQRERMRARFAHRAESPASTDFDLPAPGNFA